MKSASWRAVVALGLALALGSASGCEVTPEKIQQWKATQKGPAKLRAAVLDSKLKPVLRAQAAEALAEINLVDYLVKDLKTLPAAERVKVADSLAGRLITRMRGTSDQATTKVQVQAKDTLVSLRTAFGDGARAKVDQALVQWLAGDWASRGGGEHSAEKIVTSIGKAAAPVLATQIGIDNKVVLSLSELVRKTGTQADRDVAAAKLVALANEQNPPQKPTFEALGKIGSAKARAFLQRVAQKGKGDYRKWALRALKYDPDAATVPVAAAIAANAKEENGLRGAAFEALEKVPGKATEDALVPIITNDPKEIVRYRAIEAMAACCGVTGAQKLLEALQPRFNYKEGDVTDFIEKDLRKLGKKLVPVLQQSLSSKSWITRVVAVRLLGQLGSKADIPALQKLAGDRARLKGWGVATATVGAEAKAAVAKLKK